MEKRESSGTVGDNVNWYLENSIGDPLKTRNRRTIWHSSPSPGHIPWENHNSKRHKYPNVHSSAIYNNLDMEATWVSTDRWMDKDVVVHIYNEIFLSHKKEQIWVSWNEVDEPSYTELVIQSEISQKKKNKYHILTHTYMESTEVVPMNLFVGQGRDADVDTDLGTQWEEEGGKNWESGIDIYILLCVRQMASGKRLYKTGAQLGALWWPPGLGWGWMGGRLKREGRYVYTWLIHVHEIKCNSSRVIKMLFELVETNTIL